jgi:2-methylcitrate dehydratase PrpD
MPELLSQHLADFIAKLNYEDLPPDVIGKVKMNLLDMLGISLYAGSLPWSKIIVDQVRELGGNAEATIIGYPDQTSRPNAAFANGTFAHGLEFDNAHWSHVHPGPPVIAAALSIAEKENASGKDLITAIAAGFEISLAVGMAVFPSHRFRGFHPTATIGTFGAAAAGGKLLKLDEAHLTHCLGLAGTQASGLNEWLYSGDMSKRIHAGKAAMNGILAALLADKGLTGPEAVFEGTDGFFKAYANEVDDRPIREIGKDFEIRNVWIKPYATCADFHGAIKLALQILNTHRIAAEEIQRVEIGVDATSKKYDSKKVTTLLDAQMHYSVAIAVVLLARDGFFEAFEKWYQDPTVREMAEKVDVIIDPVVDQHFPSKWGCRVKVITKDGKIYQAAEEDRQFMSNEEIKAKFRRLVRIKMDPGTIENFIETVENLEQLSRMSDVVTQLSCLIET